jgi:hypothetical protein
MKRFSRILIAIALTLLITSPVEAHSIRHHLIDMGKNLVILSASPLYGLFIKGPRNIKEAYRYEVYGSENPQKQGLLRKKAFALWRSPGEEAKGIIDGLVDSLKAGGQFLKEFLSIFFSD